VRLTALYAVLFGCSAALLLGLSLWLVGRQLHRSLPDALANEALSDLAVQYGLALAGTLLVAVAVGWVFAGRVLSPISRITRAARLVSEEHLDERIALEDARDELGELAATLDAMLDRLSESFEAQRRFAANVSHELRSPLTVIRAEAEVALANPEPDIEELVAMAEAVVEATIRTEALLDGLLVLARSERGNLHRESLELAEVARDAMRGVEDEAGPAGVRLELRPDRVRTRGDRRLIERLIANLVENGVRHNHPGGWARVEVWAADATARVRVENSGPELDRAAADQLAEPFERAGRRDGRGAGLGLSIVRSVSEAHGGELSIAPRPGGGLTVEVALPRER
jgi:signal transduction histidine kinase